MKIFSIKASLLAVVFGLTAVAAHATEPQSSLAPINVRPAVSPARGPVPHTLDCTPPNSSRQCSAFHAEIRRNFSRREIGMLFGASAAFVEYETSYSRVSARYDNFVRNYDRKNLTAFASR